MLKSDSDPKHKVSAATAADSPIHLRLNTAMPCMALQASEHRQLSASAAVCTALDDWPVHDNGKDVPETSGAARTLWQLAA